MAEIKRIYPGGLNGVIKWLEDHFHDIDEFVIQVQLKDDTTMMVYDTYSYRNALGMLAMATNSINKLAYEGEFIQKERLENGRTQTSSEQEQQKANDDETV